MGVFFSQRLNGLSVSVLADNFFAKVGPEATEFLAEFGVALNAKHFVICNNHAVGAEITLGNGFELRWHIHHLILMNNYKIEDVAV